MTRLRTSSDMRAQYGGREVIVHRKGATPAGAGVLGIIPGSMASPGYVVRGKGSPESLNSASHGAGRVMSRTKAMQSFTWSATKKLLAERGVELLSAGLDEDGEFRPEGSAVKEVFQLVEGALRIFHQPHAVHGERRWHQTTLSFHWLRLAIEEN